MKNKPPARSWIWPWAIIFGETPVPGGYPGPRLVGKKVAVTKATPVRATRDGMTLSGRRLRRNPAAPARTSIPVTKKFALSTQPECPSANWLTWFRRGSGRTDQVLDGVDGDEERPGRSSRNLERVSSGERYPNSL